ncbi:hypothetical protein [Sphingosinicella sp.]|uniref:hypothetical protein n=1 Tax=Sphingosinicella sp. TaxID=1917971 RepID=UPI004037D82D
MLDVQRARRSGAEMALVEARKVETRARDAERSAILARDESLQNWLSCVDQVGFSPEYSRALSSLLIARDEQVHEAGVRAEAAAQLASAHEREWRAHEAKVRAGGKAQGQLKRKLTLRGEERRLAALADRVTRTWRPA